MDELDRILKNKFSPLKDINLPNEDQEWEKLQKKVKWQNFKTFRLDSMNMYYATIFLVLGAVLGAYVYSNFTSDEVKHTNEIKFIKKEPQVLEKEIIAKKATQNVVRQVDEKLKNNKARFDSRSEESKTLLPVSEKIIKDSVQLPSIHEKDIVQKATPKSKFVFKTDTIVQTDTLKVKNIKRYQKHNQTQP